MGNRHSNSLKRREIQELLKRTHFDELELQQLRQHYNVCHPTRPELSFISQTISESIRRDGVIDRQEFQQALGLKDNLFADRIFQLFDENGDGIISVDEFICGLSVFSKKGTLEEKLRFSFNVYDVDQDGFIDRRELFEILRACLSEDQMGLTPDQARVMVDATFREADVNRDGRISFEEYKGLIMRNPALLKNMTLEAVDSFVS
ncbi:putative calcineurin B [Paratrimastix pyriformis]|uniref:Calcineurin B n=1 Tax=Paratrimastix pyriformis TaxID=342808 RepID=A0ABQ8UUQ7_9EUKA|nr:putative calcineurin B [Paratrimastix pyriformis]